MLLNEGSQARYDELDRKYRERLILWIEKQGIERSVAEEIAQESLLSASQDQMRPGTEDETFIARCLKAARREIKKHLAKEENRENAESTFAESSSEKSIIEQVTPEDLAAAKDFLEKFYEPGELDLNGANDPRTKSRIRYAYDRARAAENSPKSFRFRG
jgi:hypothetical protein